MSKIEKNLQRVIKYIEAERQDRSCHQDYPVSTKAYNELVELANMLSSDERCIAD